MIERITQDILKKVSTLETRFRILETKEAPSGGGTTTFVGLTDTPANFTSAGDKLVQVNSGATALEYADHIFSDQTNNRLEIIDNGTTPSLSADTLFTVQKSGILDKSKISIISGTVGESHLLFGDSADEDIGYIFYRHLNNRLYFGTNTNDRMIIDSSGHIYVNETTLVAADMMSVTADAYNRYFSFRNTAFARKVAMHIGTNGEASFLADANLNQDAWLLFAENTTNRWVLGNDASDSDKFKINSAGANPSAGTNRLMIDTSGNVGVGTSTATNSILTVEGGIALKDGITAPSTSSGYAQIYVDSSGGDLKIKFGDGTTKTIVTDT